MSDEVDSGAIDRFMAGSASPEEAAEVRRWLAGNPARSAIVARLPGENTEGDDWNVDAAWAAFAPNLETGRKTSPARVKRIVRWSAGIAALAAAMLFTATRLERWEPVIVATTATMTSHVSPNGKTTDITLSDGTRVALNAGSTLRYSPDYGSGARDVELDGEAYFAVVHDAARPFRVRTRFGVAEDVGTRFVVRAYPELDRVEVAVAEGKVSLAKTLVAAGQLGTFAPDGSASVQSGADMERWLGWTHGTLVLDGMSLADAAVVLRRHFDVDIVITSPQLAARHVRARFRDESASRVFDALAFALSAHWSRSGGTVTITP